ncbi:protein FAM161A [Gastrophryne carolinensis]
MEQLQKMYQNKLHLKGVQTSDPAGKRQIRPAWELQPSHVDDLTCCHLKNAVSCNASSGISVASSEESDGDDEHVSISAREKVLQMWHGFNVQDYIKDAQFNKLRSKQKTKKMKQWSHRVTIPEPFGMTIRESKKKETKKKSKSEIELENNLLKKRLEEEAECQKKFRANPVPASVYLPLYDEIVERNEERRRFVKERCKEILMASQKPFQFIEREAQKKHLQQMQLAALQDPISNCNHFKARPVPKSIYGTSIDDRLKEEELYRDIRIHMRSQELLRRSSYPTRTLACSSRAKGCKGKCYEPEKEQEHGPKINTQIPNFQVVHHNNQRLLSKSKNAKHVTICDPFHLRTDNIASHRTRILEDIEADEERLKETRWPYKSPRSQPQKHIKICLPPDKAPAFKPRSTELTKRREQAVRKSIEDKVRKEEDEKRIQARKKQSERTLKKHIHGKVKATRPQHTNNSHRKVKELRRSTRQRTEDYLQELDAMKDRVSQAPLLMERTKQRSDRLCAEKPYYSVLKDLEFLDNSLTRRQPDHEPTSKERFRTREAEDEDSEDGSSQGTLEIEDLQEDCSHYAANESNEEEQQYSTDEDHTDSDS